MALDVGDPMGPNATVGSVLFVGSGPALAQDNANLFWDNTGKNLGIGTTTPINGLTVSKAVAGGNLRVDAINTSTSAGSNAWLVASVAGATAGDAVVVYDVNGVQNWATGIDNSDSDKFKIASSAALGTNDRLAITTGGNVGLGTTSPTARLHLAAGTANPATAPLKFTAGTLMSVLEDGAIEWDGLNLYRTDYTARRPFGTSLEVVNVMDFGAKGDGTADDSPPFQAAVDSLANTGGIVWVPPNRKYGIAGKVSIKSRHPIWIVSNMKTKWPAGFADPEFGSFTLRQLDAGYIRPLNMLDYIFEWDTPVVSTDPNERFHTAGGGGVEGLCFGDFDPNNPDKGRNFTIDAAVHFKRAIYFGIKDCYAYHLMGGWFRIGDTHNCAMSGSNHAQQCGDREAHHLGARL